MTPEEIGQVLGKPIARRLLASNIPARLAYTGRDGMPRAIPIAFGYNGSTIEMWTVPDSAKVTALQTNPRVALTVDTAGEWPPRVLLVRGTASVEQVDGVPQGYLDASEKVTPADEFEGWKAGVLQLYDRMAHIEITPTWAKLLDFETTIPQAVEDLAVQKFGPRSGGTS
jgi:nitroimidazol reductase NimA-like FMN-containing flavoprotein (pyridoxamine 5'-phosphate oxidase superfamily)